MTVSEIMQQSQSVQIKNIGVLAAEYKRLTGRTVCRTCGGDVSFMLRYLKNLKVMTKFEFKNHLAIYRMEKGSSERVSQNTLTDEKAIEYLSINPERISLFKSYPENWINLLQVPEPKDEDCCEDETEVPCDDCLRKALNGLKMAELKEQYPEVPTPFGMKKAALIEAIIQIKLAEAKNS